jgi:hypothetical protein
MLAIPRRYSHFIFGVIQSGLTSFIAAGTASLFRDRNRPFPVELARLMVGLVGRDVACCSTRSAGNKITINGCYTRGAGGLGRVITFSFEPLD